MGAQGSMDALVCITAIANFNDGFDRLLFAERMEPAQPKFGVGRWSIDRQGIRDHVGDKDPYVGS